MMHSNKRKVLFLMLTVGVVLSITLGLLTSGIGASAYGQTITQCEDLLDFLGKLKNGSYSLETITIGKEEPIDFYYYEDSGYQGYIQTIGFSDLLDKYYDSVVEIYFDTSIKNLTCTPSWGTSDDLPHYGLFSGVEYGTRMDADQNEYGIFVYYKVNLDVGEGTTASNLNYYRYGKTTTLPSVNAPEGKTFLGWKESGSEQITNSISATTWGVKSYSAVYEDNGENPPVDPTPGEPDNGDEPTTYPIIYHDELGASNIDLLETTYTVGNALTLGSLEKEGFIFEGWMANDDSVEVLESTLQDGLLGEDGKIHLNAVWSLENPTIGNPNAISKVYDGVSSTMSCTIEHGALESLTLSYKWYKKDASEPISTTSSLTFKDVHSGEYMLELTATHLDSGLSATVSSGYAIVDITASELTISKLNGNYNLSKVYDTTSNFSGTLSNGVHYQVIGVIGGDDVSVQSIALSYSSANAGDVELVASFSDITGDDSKNYVFAGASLSYVTSISPKAVSLQKLSNKTLSKEYDNTTDVAYQFELGVDYTLSGLLEDVSHSAQAQYLTNSASSTKVVLSVSITDNNYMLASNTLEYDATITPKTLSLIKISSPNITKEYDGTDTVDYEFKNNIDFRLEGQVEYVTPVTQAKFKSATTSATKVVLSVGISNGNYALASNTLEYDATITPKTLSLIKISSPNITKEYDGTDAVDYEFKNNIDFRLEGQIDDITPITQAKYDTTMALATKVILSVSVSDSNYSIPNNTLEYSATITKRVLKAIKLTDPTISKEYDGTRTVGYQFAYNVDFTLDGAVGDEIESASFTAIYDNANIIADKVVVIVGALRMKDGVSIDNYNYIPNTMDLYYNATITPRAIVVSGKDIVREYEETENLVDTISTGVGEETIKVRYIRESGTDVGKYKYLNAELVAPINTNYTLSFVSANKLYEIIPSVPELVFPAFQTREYNETITLMDESLIDGDNYEKSGTEFLHRLGAFSWVNKGEVATINNTIGYDMVFVPNDTTNYDYSSIEGYDPNTKQVVHKVVLNILKATPVPTLIDDSFVIAIGMRYNKLVLPQNWSIVASDEISSSSVATGENGTTATFANALVYEHDNSGNYHKIYKDLVVNYVLSEVVFTNNGNAIKGNNVTILRNLNGSVTVQLALDNPFAKEGYKVSVWTLSDGTKIYPNGDENQTYDIVNPDLVEHAITIEVGMVARDDISVEFQHYYENLTGGFDIENMDVLSVTATADTIREIGYSDLKVKQGFAFQKATLLGDDTSIENFVVSPAGDTIVAFYYERKTTTINYVDSLYVDYASEGNMPSSKTVKYGVPFIIDRPTDYLVYGYDFVGYTDGITMENGELKVLSTMDYVVMEELDSITFELRLAPKTNTLYIINRYVDGVCTTEKHYGTTGEIVDITSIEYIGHSRYAHENEKLSGTITGNIADEEGNLIKGEILTLSVYYKVESFIITLPEGLEDDFMVVEYGDVVILPRAPERKDKEFVGWVINGVRYSAGESFTMPAGDIVLEALWQDIPNDDGEIAPSPMPEVPSQEEEIVKEGKSLSDGAIIGIIVGAIGFVIIAGIVSAVVTRKQKKRAELITKLEAVNRNMFNK